MPSKSPNGSRRGTLLTFFALSLAAALFIAPAFFISEAQRVNKTKGKRLNAQTSAQNEELKNYDIRSDKKAHQKLAGLRESLGRSAAMTADVRDRFVRGEKAARPMKTA